MKETKPVQYVGDAGALSIESLSFFIRLCNSILSSIALFSVLEAQ